ncbi:helix-turn-helix transcriptional regulator [Galbitalea sp. SE-J8]|uniref:helix-turn-helix transcriptional regulator n=1 Tax=Galbitalea sp. SE-J8 TaxID=3054952 RepID=UPI00259D249F|nr:helix-turn-helix transcriptional regulator [Galbitalea sp. SE-J8]MDM4762235.1 helix-turn-helix transcriptional regulator [Galbitalea sp. SE-J8]
MDRPELAAFLRARREALRPEDVGLPRGPRRRTSGLRREEVAALAGMSTDYLNRLEQARGSQPSDQMLSALARALRLDAAERDHLFRLAGHPAPERLGVSDHVSPGMLRILDRLVDSPAQVMSELGEVLVQTPLARSLFGDRTRIAGLGRSTVHAWFSDPVSREVYPEDDHDERGATFVAQLRSVYARSGRSSRAGEIVGDLLARSPEFATLWARQDVAEKHPLSKRLQHPEVGIMTLDCQTLLDTETQQRLLVFTARPGTTDAEKLALLAVIGTQALSR